MTSASASGPGQVEGGLRADCGGQVGEEVVDGVEAEGGQQALDVGGRVRGEIH